MDRPTEKQRVTLRRLQEYFLQDGVLIFHYESQNEPVYPGEFVALTDPPCLIRIQGKDQVLVKFWRQVRQIPAIASPEVQFADYAFELGRSSGCCGDPITD